MLIIEEGSVLFGKYRIISKIGEGSFARVYLSVHIKLDTYRAIKCILKKDMLYEQLIREVNILRDIRHNNIPVIYDIEEDEDSAYIIEEYCEGPSLKEYVLAGKLNRIDKVIDYSLQISKVLEYLHSHEQRILYLDLKPDNLIVSNDVIKLIDFGAAITRDDIRRSNSYYGNYMFGSPEQIQGKRVDDKSDIYSFGKILLYMLEGLEKDNKKTKVLRKVATRCISTSPFFRYKDIGSVATRIDQLAGNKSEADASKDYSHMKIGVCENVVGAKGFDLSLMLMMFLKEKMESVYVDLSEQGNVEGLINCLKMTRDDWNMCRLQGLRISSSICDVKEEGVVINYGTRLFDCDEGVWDWEVVICMCRVKFWNEDSTRKLISYLNICDELRIVADNYESQNMLKDILGSDRKIYVLTEDLMRMDESMALEDVQRGWIERLLANE